MDQPAQHIVFLSLGTNLGDNLLILERTRTLISASCGLIVEQSSIYSGASWGYESSHIFFNQCLQVKTTLPPVVLMKKLVQIEESGGRKKGRKKGREGYEDRLIDIDLLFYDDLVIEEQDLQVPHPRLAERNFVLMPLAEIAPEWIHPVLKRSIRELADSSPDRLPVRRLS